MKQIIKTDKKKKPMQAHRKLEDTPCIDAGIAKGWERNLVDDVDSLHY